MERGAARPDKFAPYRDSAAAARYEAQRWASPAGQRRNRRKAAALERALAHFGALQRVLDLPCGTGRFRALLAARARHYTGADLALPMLLEARRAHPGAALLNADALALPFGDGCFDAVVCIRFLHLVRAPEQRIALLRELARVARAGLVVDYRHGHTLRIWSQRLRHRLGLRERAPANPSPAAIRAEVAAAGLELVEWIPVHRAPLLSDKVLLVLRPRARA